MLVPFIWHLSYSTLATSCKELTHWKRPSCWEGLGAAGEGDNRGWDGWMVSPTWWMWVWVNSGSWWWTGRPGVLRFMGSQRAGHDWVTELNWTELNYHTLPFILAYLCTGIFCHPYREDCKHNHTNEHIHTDIIHTDISWWQSLKHLTDANI